MNRYPSIPWLRHQADLAARDEANRHTIIRRDKKIDQLRAALQWVIWSNLALIGLLVAFALAYGCGCAA